MAAAGRCYRIILSSTNALPATMRVGFVVNPIAGMGGSVGLKGTDGDEILREAVSRGARRTSPMRASEALKGLNAAGFEFITCAGEMGQEELEEAGISYRVVFVPREHTDRRDTVDAVEAFVREVASMILFAGGDGTARDILAVVDKRVPQIGIPTGVKMQSGVFANTPADVAHLLYSFAESGLTKEAEVMDVDEESYRNGVLQARLYGYALVPDDAPHMQSSKTVYHSGSADEEAEELGQYIAETMERGVAYILGPGSTTAAVTRALGQEKTLLGVDVLIDGRTVVGDASEDGLLDLLGRRRDARIVVTPIGAQGFFLGRGNQQISPDVVKAVGPANVIVIATPTKLMHTPVLRVDTGDPSLDAAFRGTIKVVTGYRRRKLVPVI